jgi:hypothetical protein
LLLPSGLSISAFGESENGELFVADNDTGRLHRIVITE